MYLKTTKVSKQCHLCGETIEVIPKNHLQELAADYFLGLKTHFHYQKVHNTPYLKTKGIIKRIFKIFMCFLLGVVLFPIWLITYPFWWIHELLS